MTAQPSTSVRQRVESVDVVRGVIMIIMALDHTRDFFGNAAANPTNLATAGAGAVHDSVTGSDKYPVTQPPGWPASLPVVYLYWIAVVLLVYPACRWYAAVKARSNNPWLSYL